jgi:hypothetical protein
MFSNLPFLGPDCTLSNWFAIVLFFGLPYSVRRY